MILQGSGAETPYISTPAKTVDSLEFRLGPQGCWSGFKSLGCLGFEAVASRKLVSKQLQDRAALSLLDVRFDLCACRVGFTRQP